MCVGGVSFFVAFECGRSLRTCGNRFAIIGSERARTCAAPAHSSRFSPDRLEGDFLLIQRRGQGEALCFSRVAVVRLEKESTVASRRLLLLNFVLARRAFMLMAALNMGTDSGR